jgi:hypothetical protein
MSGSGCKVAFFMALICKEQNEKNFDEFRNNEEF